MFMFFHGISEQEVLLSFKCFLPILWFTSRSKVRMYRQLLPLRTEKPAVFSHFSLCTVFLWVFLSVLVFWVCVMKPPLVGPYKKSSLKTSHEDADFNLAVGQLMHKENIHREPHVQSQGFHLNPDPGFTVYSCISGIRVFDWNCPFKNMSPVGLWCSISAENKSSLTQDVGSSGVGPRVYVQGLHHVDSDYQTRYILYCTIHMDQGLI